MPTVEKACDFCSEVVVVARHRRDTREDVPWEEGGGEWWYACAACHRDLLAENYGGMVARAGRAIADLTGCTAYDGRQIAAKAHAIFHASDAGEWEQFGFE